MSELDVMVAARERVEPTSCLNAEATVAGLRGYTRVAGHVVCVTVEAPIFIEIDGACMWCVRVKSRHA